MHDAEPAWFEGYEDEYGEEHKEDCIIYEFEKEAFYICSEEHDGSEWTQFNDSAEEAIENAIYTWGNLTEKEINWIDFEEEEDERDNDFNFPIW